LLNYSSNSICCVYKSLKSIFVFANLISH